MTEVVEQTATPTSDPTSELFIQPTNRRTPPPAKYRFKPGVSGNPKGRPKVPSITDKFRRFLEGEAQGIPDCKTWCEALVKSIVMHAIKGDPTALKELLARVDPVKTGLTLNAHFHAASESNAYIDKIMIAHPVLESRLNGNGKQAALPMEMQA